MKLRDCLAIAGVAVFAACSSPYRATDTDNTTATVVVAPDPVRSSFTAQYPSAGNVVWSSYDATYVPIDWEMTGWSTLDQGDYLVRFDMDNDNYYAWYDETGNWIGSAYMIRDMNTVPSTISTAAKTQFPDYTITSYHREFSKDKVVYEVELKNSENKAKMVVDESGKVLKYKTKPLNQ